jgi:hypothetical protein
MISKREQGGTLASKENQQAISSVTILMFNILFLIELKIV